MEIKLLSTPSEQIARDILSGKLPPETYDLEVLEWLYELDPSLTAYRIEDKNGNSARVNFRYEEIGIALERRIEVRPLEQSAKNAIAPQVIQKKLCDYCGYHDIGYNTELHVTEHFCNQAFREGKIKNREIAQDCPYYSPNN